MYLSQKNAKYPVPTIPGTDSAQPLLIYWILRTGLQYHGCDVQDVKAIIDETN